MFHELCFGIGVQSPEAHEANMIAQFPGDAGFIEGLRGRPGDARHADERTAGLRFVDLFGREPEHALVEVILRPADLELGGVHAHGHSACAGGDVVAGEPALSGFVELPVFR